MAMHFPETHLLALNIPMPSLLPAFEAVLGVFFPECCRMVQSQMQLLVGGLQRKGRLVAV